MNHERSILSGYSLTGVIIMTTLFQQSFAGEPVRKPAVAGHFYPADPAELRRDVHKFISEAGSRPATASAPRIIISPHAGYVFSGPVAGRGYSALGSDIQTVIILGPPHRVPVRGVAAPGTAWFETPIGKVPVDRSRIQKLLQNPIACEDRKAHAPEHSIEVQIPFLQVRLGQFAIVPLLIGDGDPQKIADAIYPLIDDRTVVVVSSDFSHYRSRIDARAIDDRSIAAILAGDQRGTIDACGEMPLRVAMALAKRMALVPELLDARTSYDTYPAYGSGDRVVGYASIIYVQAQPKKQTVAPAAGKKETPDGLAPEVKSFLLTLARTSLEACVRGEKPVTPADLPPITQENRGCFVTLTKSGTLRGCIGYIEPIKPLYVAVMENAANAALSDPRFSPVTPDELGSLKVEVSVLTIPVPLDYKNPQDLLDKLVPGVDGILLKSGSRQSTFLPQVWEQLQDKTEFLEHLSLKGGMPRDGWKTANVKRYRAEHFNE